MCAQAAESEDQSASSICLQEVSASTNPRILELKQALSVTLSKTQSLCGETLPEHYRTYS